MAETLIFEKFEVTVVRSARRKTAVIKVDLDGVSVRAPADLPLARIHELVAEKTTWIERKTAEAKRKRAGLVEQAASNAILTNGSQILVQGKRLSLRLCEFEHMQVVQNSDCLEIHAAADVLADSDQVRALVEQWLYRRAVEELPSRRRGQAHHQEQRRLRRCCREGWLAAAGGAAILLLPWADQRGAAGLHQL